MNAAKILVWVLVVSLLCLLVPFPVQAAVTNIRVTVDGKEIAFDVKPYVDSQNRTMVPIRFIAQGLGYSVDWNKAANEVTIKNSGKEIKLWIGKKVALVAGQEVVMDTTAVLVQGRTMVPLRFVAENLGATVQYDEASRTVQITTGESQQRTGDGSDDNTQEITPVEGKIAVVTGSVVNVRSGPGTDYSVITQVKSGQALEVLAQKGDWYQISLNDNQTGWIAGWLVTLRDRINPSDRSPEPGEGREETGTGTEGSSGKLLTISQIQVESAGQEVVFSVISDGKLDYANFILDNPRRLVLDFFNAKFTGGQNGSQTIAVNKGLVEKIRVAQYTENQVRVVLDLLGPAGLTLVKSENNGSLLTFKVGQPTLEGKVIVIDPGHGSIQPGGWSDPGAVGPSNLYERDVVLDIAKRLAKKLEAQGAKVILTRTGDTNLTLAGRAEIANKNNADIFVSIHCNAHTNRSVGGTSTYYYGEVGGQREVRKKLAQAVQQELVKAIGLRNIGILEANFAVLRHTKVPSILVETAFISNPQEEKLLATAEFREKIAEGICNGILKYFLQ